MITIYATFDRQYVMGPELFAPTGVLARNREEFFEQTSGNSFIVSEDVYQLLPGDILQTKSTIVLISEQLFKERQKPGDRFIDEGSRIIVPGYQTALPIASNGRREVTILGNTALLEEAVRQRQSVGRMFLVRVNSTSSGAMLFPEPLLHFFKRYYKKVWPRDDRNPHDALFEVYGRRH